MKFLILVLFTFLYVQSLGLGFNKNFRYTPKTRNNNALFSSSIPKVKKPKATKKLEDRVDLYTYVTLNLQSVENIFAPNAVFHNSRSLWLDNGNGNLQFIGKIDFSVAGGANIKTAFDQPVYSITDYFDDLDTKRVTTVTDDVKNSYYSPKILLYGVNGFLGNGAALGLPPSHLYNNKTYTYAFFLNHVFGNTTDAIANPDQPIYLETIKNNEPLIFLPTARIQILVSLSPAQRHAKLREWYCEPGVGYYYSFAKEFFDANQLTLEKFRC